MGIFSTVWRALDLRESHLVSGDVCSIVSTESRTQDLGVRSPVLYPLGWPEAGNAHSHHYVADFGLAAEFGLFCKHS